MGDMADVDVGDLLDFLAADVSTSAILLYLETIPAARKFMSAARSAARAKPVIAIRSGRNAAAAKAAATHTGALAGTDAAVSDDLVNALDKVLPAHWSRAYPIDIIGDAGPERCKATLDAVLAEPKADGILVMRRLSRPSASVSQ